MRGKPGLLSLWKLPECQTLVHTLNSSRTAASLCMDTLGELAQHAAGFTSRSARLSGRLIPAITNVRTNAGALAAVSVNALVGENIMERISFMEAYLIARTAAGDFSFIGPEARRFTLGWWFATGKRRPHPEITATYAWNDPPKVVQNSC